jgi:hypothetical protein
VSDRQLPLPPACSGMNMARRDRAATMFLSCFPTHAVALIFPSAVDPPVRGAGQAVGVQVERPRWTNDLDCHGLVCSARPRSSAGGMIGHHPSCQLPRGLSAARPGAGAPPPEAPSFMRAITAVSEELNRRYRPVHTAHASGSVQSTRTDQPGRPLCPLPRSSWQN